MGFKIEDGDHKSEDGIAYSKDHDGPGRDAVKFFKEI
jgi:hypothetical protein